MNKTIGLKVIGAVTLVVLLLSLLLISGGYALSECFGMDVVMQLVERAHMVVLLTYLSGALAFVYLFASVAADDGADQGNAFANLGITAIFTMFESVMAMGLTTWNRALGIVATATAGIVALILNGRASTGKKLRIGYTLASAIPALLFPIRALVMQEDLLLTAILLAVAVPLFSAFVIADLRCAAGIARAGVKQ